MSQVYDTKDNFTHLLDRQINISWPVPNDGEEDEVPLSTEEDIFDRSSDLRLDVQ